MKKGRRGDEGKNKRRAIRQGHTILLDVLQVAPLYQLSPW